MTVLSDSIHQYRAHLADILDESLNAIVPSGTDRVVRGTVYLPGKATAVIGMRRAGKTTFLHQVRRDRLLAGTPRERLVYVNFEDERLAGLPARELHLLLEEYYRRFPDVRGAQSVTWCLDEIQVVPGWERFVRRILDSERVEVFVSGSSAALLSQEIATSMRGRAWEVVVHPFSFSEALRHKGAALPSRPEFLASAERSRLERAFLDYLSVGGFPEVQNSDATNRRRLLSDYVDVAILRDVVERHGVTNVVGLRWMVRHLLGNAAGLFSAEKFHAALRSQGLAIARDTVHALLSHIVDCFLVRTVWMEAGSERQRMVNPRKTYPIDPGLIPVFDRARTSNLGHALETAVYLELERRRLDVTYVRPRAGGEVDFLARDAVGGMELIQVCADATGEAALEREIPALVAAGREHPRAVMRLLTATKDAIPSTLPDGVVGQPAYEWMLST